MWVAYPCYNDQENDFMYYSFAGNVIFVGFYTLLTGLGFTLIFLPVLFGKIPVAYAVLSWKPWTPIAKASFSIYLTHTGVMRWFTGNEQYGFEMSQINIFADFVFDIIIVISIGVLVYISVEAPFGRLLKLAITPRSVLEKSQPLISMELKSVEK